MKKIIAVFMTVSMLLCGCSEAATSESVVEESSSPSRVSTSALDVNLIGKWWNGSSGYIFGEDRKVSLIMNFSDMDIYFTKDGDFMKAGETVGKENVSYDGENLLVKYMNESEEGMDILTLVNMKRKDEKNPDSIDGVYDLYGGLLIQFFAETVGLTFEQVLDDENITLEAVIDGENFTVTMNNYCDYETIGGQIQLFSKYMTYVDQNATSVNYNYTIEKDALTMRYSADPTAEPEVYQRAED